MTQALQAAMQLFQPALPLGVAYSGGADSTALLHLVAARWPGQVVALHVNHGLQAAAADFEKHCQKVCLKLGVPLRFDRVQAHPAKGQSPEDAARQARYDALHRLAFQAGETALAAIALAQHADDQIETLLLALSRGSGLAGMSGMATQWQKDGLIYYRPLLKVAGTDLRQWLVTQEIEWIEDPTNCSEHYTRNRIRKHILPALERTFTSFRATFVRSATHAAQAQALLEEVAQSDLQLVRCLKTHQPLINRLQAMTAIRRANLLRYWLKQSYAVIPSEAQLLELQRQIENCTTRGHKIHIKVGDGVIARHLNVLTWYNPALSNTRCL
jgi:tRNA(Ile)-lysidine synthase